MKINYYFTNNIAIEENSISQELSDNKNLYTENVLIQIDMNETIDEDTANDRNLLIAISMLFGMIISILIIIILKKEFFFMIFKQMFMKNKINNDNNNNNNNYINNDMGININEDNFNKRARQHLILFNNPNLYDNNAVIHKQPQEFNEDDNYSYKNIF